MVRGAGSPSSIRRGKRRASRRLRMSGRWARVSRHGARTVRSLGVPRRRPRARIRSISSTSSSRRIAACSTRPRVAPSPIGPPCPRWCGKRWCMDSRPDLQLVGKRQAHAVPADAVNFAARPVGRKHVNDGKSLVRQAEELCGAPVREDGATLTGEHGSEHPPRSAYRAMANRERSVKKGLQIPRRDPVVDGAVKKPKFPQLPARDNPVLPSRQRRNRMPRASGALFPRHRGIRRTGAKFAPPGADS